MVVPMAIVAYTVEQLLVPTNKIVVYIAPMIVVTSQLVSLYCRNNIKM